MNQEPPVDRNTYYQAALAQIGNTEFTATDFRVYSFITAMCQLEHQPGRDYVGCAFTAPEIARQTQLDTRTVKASLEKMIKLNAIIKDEHDTLHINGAYIDAIDDELFCKRGG